MLSRVVPPYILLVLLSLAPANAETNKPRPAPGTIDLAELKDFGTLPLPRKKLVRAALVAIQKHNFNRYLFGSSDPANGAFDCSGAIDYLLRQVDIQPPRSSSAQFAWIKKSGNLTALPPGTSSLDDPVFAKLQPGDLIFWSGTYKPRDGRTNNITHVQMYLGREKSDGLRVMVGSSDGRSYRGTARCGFGLYDLKLPRKTSKAKLVGFGPPPGLADKSPEEKD